MILVSIIWSCWGWIFFWRSGNQKEKIEVNLPLACNEKVLNGLSCKANILATAGLWNLYGAAI